MAEAEAEMGLNCGGFGEGLGMLKEDSWFWW